MSELELPRLPARDPAGHKGTFGTVAVIGGCAERPTDESGGVHMVGGPALAALGALRAGAGLVRLVMPEPVLDAGLGIAPSATGIALPVDHQGLIVAHKAAFVIDGLLGEADCLVIGPGMGVGDGARAATLRAVAQDSTPVVVDADAINNLSTVAELVRDFRAPAVLTPHVGEFRRLAAGIGMNIGGDAPPQALEAEMLAQRLGCVVVLKSARTIVSDGHRTWENPESESRNSALATAGTGDVLAGLIGGLIAQFHRRPIVAGERTITSERLGGLSLFDCARLGVAAHARAARQWTQRAGADAGMLAAELADGLPAALQTLR